MHKNISDRILSCCAYIFIILFSAFCLYPLLLTLGVSFSKENLVQIHGYKLIPEVFSLETYQYLFYQSGERILRSYGVTILVTLVGTMLAMIVTSMMGYAISIRSLKYRNFISLYSYFTVIFSAGMIPWYIICVNYLHFRDNILGLIIPYLINVWFLFLLRNFFQSIPDAIFESAKIDGAGYFTIYYKIALPLSKTPMLTVALFYALQYWNDWWLAIMFISKQTLFPLQYYLYTIVSNVQALSSGQISSSAAASITLPSETVKMAVTVVAIGPIIFLYPLVQKYFVKGVMVGGVKG